MKQKMYIIGLLLFFSGCFFNSVDYEVDLDFIYQTIFDNHPGIFNKKDPAFVEHMKLEYSKAKEKLRNVQNDQERRSALTEFGKSFNDTHLWICWQDEMKKNSVPKAHRPYSFERLSEDAVWITAPTFHFYHESQKQSYEQVLEFIPTIRDTSYIVFDVRGNGGGNSQYGRQIVSALFGQEYFDLNYFNYSKNEYVDWRVSEGNLQHLDSIIEQYPGVGCEFIREGMHEQLQKGEPFYKEEESEEFKGAKHAKSLLSSKTEIIVLIDRYNVSAALDFIDQLQMMTKNITLIGEATKFDRNYMEVRSVNLPSGLGELSFPIKVYRNRPRKDKQRYLPDIKFDKIDNIHAIKNYIVNEFVKKKLK